MSGKPTPNKPGLTEIPDDAPNDSPPLNPGLTEATSSGATPALVETDTDGSVSATSKASEPKSGTPTITLIPEADPNNPDKRLKTEAASKTAAALKAALEEENKAGQKAELNNDPNTTPPNNTTSTNKHIFPLNTRMEELHGYQQYLVDNNKFQKNDKPLGISGLKKYNLLGNPANVIKKMDFNTYWDFRNYQIQLMRQNLLNRLKLLQEAEGEEPKDTSNRVSRFFGSTEPFADRKAYFEKMLDLLQDVAIVPDPNNNKENKTNNMLIQKNGKTLVSISENVDGDLNNMEFKIPKEIVAAGGKDLDNAVALLVDQATRVLERSNDHEKAFHITGNSKTPEVALKMYKAAFLNGLKPEVSKKDLAHWQDQAENASDPATKEKFTQALKDHEELTERFKKKGFLHKARKLMLEKAQKAKETVAAHHSANRP
jgi:hypothetical protein